MTVTEAPTAAGTVVPAVAVDVLTAHGAAVDVDAFAAATTTVANRDVIDTTLLPEPAGVLCRDYWAATQRLWDRLAAGRSVGTFVVVSRVVVDDREQTGSRGSKRDLADAVAALDDIAALADVVDDVLAAEPDWAWIGTHPAVVAVERDDPKTSLTVTAAATDWPAVLGGASCPGEIRRHLTLGVNHAKWRDRRNRRLTHLTVTVEELWPDPAEWTTGP